jgi:CRISPR system Cascade subunit CasD
MTAFLIIGLYAPMASWGEIAVGEIRGSWDRPSRSAILGLFAASLGIVREDADAHAALDTQYGVAVRVDSAGAPMVDYHTAQTVAASAVKRQRPMTRAALLEADEPQTILSRRTYRVNSLTTVALWMRRADARWALDALRGALLRPTFALFAGRKCNPFGLPLAPQVIEAATIGDAFQAYSAARGMRDSASEPSRTAVTSCLSRLRPRTGWGTEVSLDAPDGVVAGLMMNRRERRRDASPHRVRWQFAERTVHVGHLAASIVPEPADDDSAGADHG